jgi:hypothetical protein
MTDGWSDCRLIIPSAVACRICNTVRSESHCGLGLRYCTVQACTDARGNHFHHVLQVHNDFPNTLYYSACHNFLKK